MNEHGPSQGFLDVASPRHQHVVGSFAAVMTAGMYFDVGGIASQGTEAISQMNPIIYAIIWALAIYHGVSVFRLARCVKPDTYGLAILGLMSPMFFFLPSVITIISANKLFRQYGWKVHFYGGASPPYPSRN